MILEKLKFKHKLFLLIGLILTIIIGFHAISVVENKKLSVLILNLIQNNEALNSSLVKLTQVERLKSDIDKYQTSPSESYLTKIDYIFDDLLSHHEGEYLVNPSIAEKQKLLTESIRQYQKTFAIARKQIPRSYKLREELRRAAEALEDKISKIVKNNNRNNIVLVLLIKSVLESEKNAIRFLETNNFEYMNKVQESTRVITQQINQLRNLGVVDSTDLKAITALSHAFNKKIKQLVGHYRTYSMVTKVLMPGNANEINIYSRKLQEEILNLIETYKGKIDSYHQKSAQLNTFFSVFLSLIVLISLFMITRLVTGTFSDLTNMFTKLAEGKKDVEIPDYKHNDEIGQLIASAVKFKKINQHTEQLLKETQDYRDNLEIRVEQESKVRAEQEKVLIQQSKLAAMGEMIGSIAHQWRQPLNELSIRIQKLKYAFAKDQVDESYIQRFVDKNNQTILFMSRTIDDFRNFFRIDKEKSRFGIRKAIEEVLNIQEAQLRNYHIEVSMSGEDFEIVGFKRELQQAILNIINNSKDALIANKTSNPAISIKLTAECQLLVEDNGGGISEEFLGRVMDPYFTTKPQGEGTGMGLYMCKMIIVDNMKGRIDIENHAEGVRITIDLKGLHV